MKSNVCGETEAAKVQRKEEEKKKSRNSVRPHTKEMQVSERDTASYFLPAVVYPRSLNVTESISPVNAVNVRRRLVEKLA